MRTSSETLAHFLFFLRNGPDRDPHFLLAKFLNTRWHGPERGRERERERDNKREREREREQKRERERERERGNNQKKEGEQQEHKERRGKHQRLYNYWLTPDRPASPAHMLCLMCLPSLLSPKDSFIVTTCIFIFSVFRFGISKKTKFELNTYLHKSINII